MTKNQLAKEVAVSENLHLSTAFKAVDGILRIMKETLAGGEEVSLRGFGALSPVQREGRVGRNPQTGQEKFIPAHRTVKFRVSKELRETLNGNG